MKIRNILIGSLGGLALAVLLFFMFSSGNGEVNARLDGKLFEVKAQIGGKIKKSDVQADMFVSRDFPMFEIENPEAVEAYEQAGAALVSIEQGIVSPEASLSVSIEHFEQRVVNAVKAESEVKKRREELSLSLAEAAYKRRKAEASPKTYSKEYLARARAAEKKLHEEMADADNRLELAAQTRVRAEQELAAVKKQFNLFSTPQGMQALRQYELEAARERLQLTEENIAALTVCAPADGYVLEAFAAAGSEIEPGSRLASIVPLDAEFLWLNAYFDEKTAAGLSQEQPCTIEFSAIEGLILNGRVRSIRPATLAVPLPDDEFAANFSNVENLVPVIVSIDDYDPAEMPQLRLGMTARVTPQ